MTDTPPLPDLHRSTLDADGVRALADAVLSAADPVEVSVKRGATDRGEGTPDVHEAIDALLDGSAVAVQLYYQLEGSTWIDTIVRRPEGFEVVRIEQTF